MAGKGLVLCDTNILIHILRGRLDIKNKYERIGQENIRISCITAAEIYNGAQSKLQLAQLENWLNSFTMYPVNEDTSQIFFGLIKNYTLSHRISIPDALIAATAISYGLPLYTENLKDFAFIPELNIYRAK